VSNYRETRLYAKSKGQGADELFRLEDLADLAELRRFRALLGRDALLPPAPGAPSALDELLLDSDRKDREITEGLYARYREIRARLFAELRRAHRKRKPAELLRHAQTLLDRILFVAFAEDRGLLPSDTIAGAYTHRDPYHPRPVWENFAAVFRWVDVGNPAMKFAAYNGGLFQPDPDLDALALSDEACGWFKELASYDYRDDDPEGKAIEARWREGFDVVLGNPPYVRQELLTRFKDHWRETFRAFHGAYRLAAADEALLWATAPPRMPFTPAG